MNRKKQLSEGVITNNPVLVQQIGLCATMAISTSLFNGLGMGLSVLIILTCCNVVVSLIRKVIPEQVRLAIFVVVIAGFVTIVDLLLQAFVPALSESLGVFIPLIVVNCIILGRAEAFAMKNKPIISFFDGLGMGLGFTVALVAIGSVREIIGSGTLFGFHILPESYVPCSIFILAPGAFFVFAGLTALQNKLKMPSATNGDAPKGEDGEACKHSCLTCGIAGCGDRNK